MNKTVLILGLVASFAFNSKVTPYLKKAITQTANQGLVEVNKTDAIGCSIKRIK